MSPELPNDSAPEGNPPLRRAPRSRRAFPFLAASTGLAAVFAVAAFLALEEHLSIQLTLLLTAVGVTTGLAGLTLGHHLAHRHRRPLRRLAGEIRASTPERPPRLWAGDSGDDELSALAEALDGYAQRVRAYVRREQEFTADVSHELRNGLAVLDTTTELLENRQREPTAQAQIRRLRRAVERMKELVRVLLLLAREPERATGEADTVQVATVVRDEVRVVHELGEDLRRRLHLSVAAEPTAAGSATLLAVVVRNLVNNALAHAAPGHVEIRVETDGVIVEDDGPGIPEAELPHLFDRAYRGSRAAEGGTGLGLAIVRRLCEHHGWTIRIQNRNRGGVRAQLRLVATLPSDLA